jgi:hypothetical protein
MWAVYTPWTLREKSQSPRGHDSSGAPVPPRSRQVRTGFGLPQPSTSGQRRLKASRVVGVLVLRIVARIRMRRQAAFRCHGIVGRVVARRGLRERQCSQRLSAS